MYTVVLQCSCTDGHSADKVQFQYRLFGNRKLVQSTFTDGLALDLFDCKMSPKIREHIESELRAQFVIRVVDCF